MADKVEKPKKSKPKPKKDEKNVLGSLSSSRPERIGTRRAGAAAAKTAAKTGAPGTKTTAAPGKAPSAGPKKAATARATATRRKAAAPRTFEPTEAAESAAGAADERAAGALPRA